MLRLVCTTLQNNFNSNVFKSDKIYVHIPRGIHEKYNVIVGSCSVFVYHNVCFFVRHQDVQLFRFKRANKRGKRKKRKEHLKSKGCIVNRRKDFLFFLF